MPAGAQGTAGALPISLAHDVPLVRDVAEGQVLSFADALLEEDDHLALHRDALRIGASNGSRAGMRQV